MMYAVTQALHAVLLAVLAIILVADRHAGNRGDLRLCDGIYGYLLDSRADADRRMSKLSYYRQHPDEKVIVLKDFDDDVERFARLCGTYR